VTSPHALKLYVDGSAFRNPGHEGGFSVFAEYPDSFGLSTLEVANGSYEETTNNRMELRACIEAFKFARKEVERLKIRHVIVVTDSHYVYSNQYRAIYWKRDNWENRDGRPVDNPDLWKEFLSLKQKVRANLEVNWQKGKTTQILNAVDKGAKQAAKGIKTTDFGFRRGKISRTKVRGGGILMFPANGQKEIIRVFKYENKAINEWKVCFELYSEEKGGFISKHFAYIRSLESLHRHGYYKASFNDNSQYPLIEILEVVTSPEKGIHLS